ncbi:MAG: response regulator [Desulfovibrionales bacterium]
MKTLLVVIDDKTTLDAISRRLQVYEDISVLTALNGKDAFDLVNAKAADLILTDSQMPVSNGLLLLSYLSEHYPEIPVFALIDQGTAENESKFEKLGISRFFYKPLNMDILIEAIVEELNVHGENQIHCMSLPAILQLVTMENKTCTLTIIPDKGASRGKLYCVEGELFAAKVGDLENEEAAYEILSWEKVSIFIDETCREKTKKITQPLMSFLMESGRGKIQNTGQASGPEKQESSAIQEKPAEPFPETLDIIEVLEKEASIDEYVLYDDQDRKIPIENSGSDPFGHLKPSKFFRPLTRFRGTKGNGRNKYLLIHTKSGKQIVLFQVRDIRVIASLKSCLSPTRAIKNMHPLLFTQEI